MANEIFEHGVVVDEHDGELGVKVTTPGSCESCPVHDRCYSGGQVLWMPKKSGIHVDDHVRFSIGNGSVLKITSLVYGVPLVALIGGIVAGYLGFFNHLSEVPQTLLSFGVGVALMGLSGFILSRFDSRLKRSLSYSVELEH